MKNMAELSIINEYTTMLNNKGFDSNVIINTSNFLMRKGGYNHRFGKDADRKILNRMGTVISKVKSEVLSNNMSEKTKDIILEISRHLGSEIAVYYYNEQLSK